jgi:hypothetical protein
VKKHLIVRLGLSPIELVPGTVFTIGREPTCSLTIPVSKVSRQHAEIRWQDGKPLVVDLASANGTLVAGRRVTEHALAQDDELQIGPFVGVYRFADPLEIKAEALRTSGAFSRTTAGADGPTLTGAIEDAGLGEVLQGFEFNAKTGTLNAYDRGESSWVTLHDGLPGAAEGAGKLDLEAVIHMLELKQGRFLFEPSLKAPEIRMATTITAILLEWSRRLAQLPPIPTAPVETAIAPRPSEPPKTAP